MMLRRSLVADDSLCHRTHSPILRGKPRQSGRVLFLLRDAGDAGRPPPPPISGMQYAGEQQGAAWSQKVPALLAMVLKGDFGVFNPVFTLHETNIKVSSWNVASPPES